MFLKNTSHQVCLTYQIRKLALTLLLIGPQSFVNQAYAISSTIQELYNRGPSHWVFYHRFMFVTSYAEFQDSLMKKNYANAAKSLITMISEELAPRAWGAILLNDSIPLLQYSKNT
jgi:nuclear pore complex protein Nup85